ncbi:MAG: hypothetical protein HY275_08095 [Gemmatimonadetes bacterium]|nr:hypothetical protein [Gemmatimonadota bacterium]
MPAADDAGRGPRVYCTLFDRNYLLKGLVMLQSLRAHAADAVVYVLCMDTDTFDLLGRLALPGVRRLVLADVEDDALRAVKPTRSVAEYCWTLSPALCWHVMQACPEAAFVTYLDADLMFFSDVEPLYAEMGARSVSITDHRYPPALAHLQMYGRFNVQWVGFRRDEIGLRCLARWRAQCIEWCFARLEAGRLGDQKYLEEWPALYGDAVHVIAHPGAGVGPWNVFASRVGDADGRVTVDGAPLIFYHYHQFQLLAGGGVDYMPPLYQSLGPPPMAIYGAYERALEGALAQVRAIEPTFTGGLRSTGMVSARRFVQRFVPTRVKNFLRRVGLQPW